MDAEQEDKLLQHCPWCGYSLRGLPVQHRCPECGQEFDRRWQIYPCHPPEASVGKWRLRDYLELITFLILIAMPLEILRGLIEKQLGWVESLTGLNPILLVYMCLVFLPSLFSRRSPMGFIAIGPSDVVVGNRRDRTVQSYPWRNVKEAVRDWWSGVIIELEDGRIELSSVRHRRDCVERINDRVDDEEWARWESQQT